jgi:hypothetical protein
MATAKPWSLTSNYSQVTLKYDLYVTDIGYVAKAGETLIVHHVDANNASFVLVDGWDDLAFYVHPTLIATVQ